jgi:hypothetical protein
MRTLGKKKTIGVLATVRPCRNMICLKDPNPHFLNQMVNN